MSSRPSSQLRTAEDTHHASHGIQANAARNNSIASSINTITPPPHGTPALLLLEGDEMFISRDGKSHTVYQLREMSNTIHNDTGNHSFRDLVLEETYDIGKARKKMSLLGPSILSDSYDVGNSKSDTSQMARIFSFDLQEINHGVQNGSGTGSMSWDSSIVMGLYFAVNPNELRGNVLELGSGVGLGGILSNMATNMIPSGTALGSAKRSVTLSDVNDEVLSMLQHNIEVAIKSSCYGASRDIDIQKLDWFGFLGDTRSGIGTSVDEGSDKQYDTIIASDCAYLHSQIAPLSETISKLLGKNKRREQKLHMFAPYNRGAVHELIYELLIKKDMHVDVDEIEMSKYRMKQGNASNDYTSPSAFKAKFFSEGSESLQNGTCAVSKFLHIKAWHKTGLAADKEAHIIQPLITDID